MFFFSIYTCLSCIVHVRVGSFKKVKLHNYYWPSVSCNWYRKFLLLVTGKVFEMDGNFISISIGGTFSPGSYGLFFYERDEQIHRLLVCGWSIYKGNVYLWTRSNYTAIYMHTIIREQLMTGFYLGKETRLCSTNVMMFNWINVYNCKRIGSCYSFLPDPYIVENLKCF